MALVGEKIGTSTKQEKIKLLTYLGSRKLDPPKDCKRIQSDRSYGIPTRSRQLKKEKGILANPDVKRSGQTIAEDV